MRKRGSFVLLNDVEDLADVVRSAPQALEGSVMAFETDVHLALIERGVDHLTPWDVIAYDELPAVQAYERRVLDHWQTHASLEFEGIDLLSMARYRHLSAFARLSWATYAVSRFVEAIQPECVWAFEEDRAHGLDQPVDYRRMPLLSGLVRGVAAHAGIPVRLINRAHPRFEDRVVSHRLSDREPVDVAEALGERDTVIFQANRTDLLRQLPLIRAIRAELDCNVVQLFKEAAPDLVRQASTEGQCVWHESQVVRAMRVPDTSELVRDSRQRFDSAGRAARDDLRLIFDNPHVRAHFDFLFGPYAARMAQHVVEWRDFFERCRPSAVVCNYHAPLFDVAADAGIACLGLSHALMMIGQPHWYDSLPRRAWVGAFGSFHRERLVAHGIAAGRIRITGDPWADDVDDRIATFSDHRSVCRLRSRLGIEDDRKVVLLCTGSFGMPAKSTTLPTMDWAQGVRDMGDLAELARRRTDLAFVIKPHPRFDYPALYARINRDLPPDCRLIVTEASLPEIGTCADVVCMWNTVSSALVEASMLDRPVLLYSRCLVWCDLEHWAIDAWPRTQTIQQFEWEVDRLIGDAAHRAKRIAQSKAALARFMGDWEVGSTSRCLDVLKDCMHVGAACA